MWFRYFFLWLAPWLLILPLLHTANANEANKIGKPSPIPGVFIVSAEEVLQLADYDEEMVVFDVRPQTARKQGKIRWSERFKNTTAKRLAEIIAAKDTVVVFYGDNNSARAARGAKLVAGKGYKNVYWLKGGWQEWRKKGLKMDE